MHLSVGMNTNTLGPMLTVSQSALILLSRSIYQKSCIGWLKLMRLELYSR
jgi:hypothetical protein